jgi:hypothetical protein
MRSAVSTTTSRGGRLLFPNANTGGSIEETIRMSDGNEYLCIDWRTGCMLRDEQYMHKSERQSGGRISWVLSARPDMLRQC